MVYCDWRAVGDEGDHLRALARCRTQRQVAAQGRGALVHADQPEMALGGQVARHLRWHEPVPVVFSGQGHPLVSELQLQTNAAGLPMPHGIADRGLGDAVDRQLGFRR